MKELFPIPFRSFSYEFENSSESLLRRDLLGRSETVNLIDKLGGSEIVNLIFDISYGYIINSSYFNSFFKSSLFCLL